MRGGLLAAVVALALSGCARDRTALYGSYVGYGLTGEPLTPPVTLRIARPDRYLFCEAGQCVAGRWALPDRADGCEGRITFFGKEVEALVRRLAVEAGPDPVWTQRGNWNEVDLDYSACVVGASITLGTGDAAFVKQ